MTVQGVIGPGDLQWMTAGRGIVHAEMPKSDGVVHGLQLWYALHVTTHYVYSMMAMRVWVWVCVVRVNLAAKDKLVEPAYQELLSRDIPKPQLNGITATVIAGTAFGVTSPVYTRTPTTYLDFKMPPHATLTQASRCCE